MSLAATALGKRYGRTWALRDCSLEVPAGRIAGLVGPNGAGKTTLLSLAVGLLRPTTGTVRVLGQSPVANPHVLERVGFVAQDTPLYRDFTALDLLTLGAKLNRRFDLRLSRDRLAQLEVPLERPVGSLSGGQRAQVALALVLGKRPEVLLLDEPVASLDPLARREFLQALAGSVAEGGLTVVLSSHLIADLERLCDYLIVLSESHVQVLGSVDELLAEHRVLVGPRGDAAALARFGSVIQESHTDRQTTALIRTTNPIADPAWSAHDVSLEELVLAYLGHPAAGTLPGPRRAGGPS